MNTIKQFTGKYAFLSNFYPATVTYEGDTYPTAEHAFQAAKTIDPAERAMIRAKPTPGKAKAAGRKVTLRPHWEAVKVAVMRQVVAAKFEQHPDLMDQLMSTGIDELEEGNHWNDRFWGVDIRTGKGLNELGNILMLIRSIKTM